jgi:predicted peptidase
MRDQTTKSAINKSIILILIPILLIATALFFNSCTTEKKGDTIRKTPFKIVDKWGNEREYRVFLPPGAFDNPLPLLVYFHGVWSEEFKEKIPALRNYTGSPVEETGLIELSRKKKFILLVPEAYYELKALKNCTAKGWKMDEEIDGIEKIIDKIAAEYNIIKQEIYLAGISAGAVLCHHLANKRPYYYAAVLSHSQAYTDREGKGKVRKPAVKGPQFGVIFAYTKGDYANLIDYCTKSYTIYKKSGYRTKLLKNLPPRSHTWAGQSNDKFWDLLQKLKRTSRAL